MSGTDPARDGRAGPTTRRGPSPDGGDGPACAGSSLQVHRHLRVAVELLGEAVDPIRFDGEGRRRAIGAIRLFIVDIAHPESMGG